MNREIKFRAWDGEKMVSPDFISRDGAAHWRESSIAWLTKKDVMQYTGLKDKKWKEIYEGDIVQLFSCKRPIVFNGGGFGYYTEMDNGEFIFLGSNRHFEWKENQSDKIKVIGNIYEHSHLLNKEQSVKESDTSKAT